MLTIPPNQKPQLDTVDTFIDQRDFNPLLFDAIATGDKGRQHYLIYGFNFGPEGARRKDGY